MDVLHLCQPPDIYFPLAWLHKLLGAAVLVDQRDLMPELFGSRQERPARAVTAALRWLERRTQRVADETVCVNEYLQERLIGAGALPEQVTIVRNGPVLGRVRSAVGEESLRQGRSFLCCWTGKMGRQDRLDLVLRAVDHVVHDLGIKDIGFVLLGDGECFAEAATLSSRLALDPWVSFPGWAPESTVFSYLATADLGLDASLQEEVSPVKVLEYMAFGLPFVSFDLRETTAIGDGAGAYLPPGDVDALAGELVSLLGDPDRRAAMARVGRQRVRDDLAWKHQATRYLSVMDRLCGAARAPRPPDLGVRPPDRAASHPGRTGRTCDMRTRTRTDVPRIRSQDRFGAAAVAGSALVVATGSVAQVVDYAFFDLRIGVLDSSEDGGAFGVVGDAAAVAAAAAAWWFLAREPSKRAAVVALPPLLTFIALDKVVRLHDRIPHYLAFYAPVLVGTFLCLVVLIRRLPPSCARPLATGAVLLAASFVLHLIGERVLLELGLADAGWAAQLKAVVKHGCEVEGWLLVLISLAFGAHQGRRRPAARHGRSSPGGSLQL